MWGCQWLGDAARTAGEGGPCKVEQRRAAPQQPCSKARQPSLNTNLHLRIPKTPAILLTKHCTKALAPSPPRGPRARGWAGRMSGYLEAAWHTWDPFLRRRAVLSQAATNATQCKNNATTKSAYAPTAGPPPSASAWSVSTPAHLRTLEGAKKSRPLQ